MTETTTNRDSILTELSSYRDPADFDGTETYATASDPEHDSGAFDAQDLQDDGQRVVPLEVLEADPDGGLALDGVSDFYE